MKPVSEKLSDGLNKQITAEFESAYLYLAMADFLQGRNFDGMAYWFRKQADEEKTHAMKIHDFLIERHLTPVLGEIKAPNTQWTGVMNVFDEAYQHECLVSSMIYDLVAQAMEDKDYASLSMLQWFVDEQVEEEEQSLALLEKARMIDDVASGLMVLDQQMGARTD
ncbi:MAG: ferritin [Alphaproteobacteria bacterium]|nr:ferritin [Alphaproteobacteria bacterium]